MAAMVDALAVGAGAVAAFNPCGVGLLPTYLAFLLEHPAPAAWPAAARQGLQAGGAMTVGLLAPFTLLALTFGAVAGWVGPHLNALGAGLGLALALWGAVLVLRPGAAGLSLHMPLPRTEQRGTVGMLAYGIVFGLVSLGCTFPIFLSLLVQATTAGGAVGGALTVLLYALGMGAVVTALAVAARTAAAAARRFTLRAAALAPRLAGAVALLSGLFVAAYFQFGLVL